MSKNSYHYLLRTQLANLDLSSQNPPSTEEWETFLSTVDDVYAQAQAVSQQKSQVIATLIDRVQQQSAQETENATLERKLKESMLLNRIIEATTSTLEPDEILQILCRELANHLQLPHTVFATLNENEESYNIVAEYVDDSIASSKLGSRVSIKPENWDSIFSQNQKSVIFAHMQEDQSNPYFQALTPPEETLSVLIVPLKIERKVVGFLGLSTANPRRFSRSETAIVEKVAAVAGQAIAQAQLYTDLKVELAERKATEIALKQARDEAMEASRIKSQLIAKVSHELRTPLNSIMGFAEMLQLGVFGPLDTDQSEILKKVLLSTEYLVLLVNDLLDMAKLESGRMTLEQAIFSPIDLIDRVESALRRQALKKGLNFYITLDPGMPLEIWGDIDRIFQILINLIDNAIKFTHVGNVHVNISRSNKEQYQLIVQDTGVGIPLNQHEAIFDQFQQASVSTVRNQKGIGLGLSIVKQLVTMMDGTILLESEVNQGSKFTITLPLIPAQAASDLHVDLPNNKRIRTSA